MRFYPEDPIQKIMRRRLIAKLKRKIHKAKEKGETAKALALAAVVAYLEHLDRMSYFI